MFYVLKLCSIFCATYRFFIQKKNMKHFIVKIFRNQIYK